MFGLLDCRAEDVMLARVHALSEFAAHPIVQLVSRLRPELFDTRNPERAKVFNRSRSDRDQISEFAFGFHGKNMITK